jgi:NAD-dependent deacetylase
MCRIWREVGCGSVQIVSDRSGIENQGVSRRLFHVRFPANLTFMGSAFSFDRRELDIFGLQESDVYGGHVTDANTVEAVVGLIRRNRGRVAIITGAGVSADQLPTFRSGNNTGLWESFSVPLLDSQNFYQNPSPSWRLLANIRNLQAARILHPSKAHHAMHHLLAHNFVSHVITQNIDGLHSFSGDTDRVIELHGAVSDCGICENCGKVRTVDHLSILRTSKAPSCEVCGVVLKPPVAFFGDVIDKQKREQAYKVLEAANVLLLVGTHCTVDPVMSLALKFKQGNGIVVEINVAPTTASRFCDISLVGKADDIMMAIATDLIADTCSSTLAVEDWEPTWPPPPASGLGGEIAFRTASSHRPGPAV